MRAAIVNVTGYAGVELARILLRHPRVELVQVTGRSAAGQNLSDYFPHLGQTGLKIADGLTENVDVAFLALPHKESAAQVPALLDRGIRVVDVGADFRLRDVATYEKWYNVTHSSPHLVGEAVYGLPELHKVEIAKARLVANPGCYPTSAILALAPAAGLIVPDIIVDSKSGVSGAGRTLALNAHYCEINENCHPYGLAGHRHMTEMAQELDWQRKRTGRTDELALTFVPHLTPMTRGIVSTCYARLEKKVSAAELLELYADFYRDAPFVRVSKSVPETKQTWGSNYCMVHPTVDERTNRLIAIGCIDNLVKGAAGQAVQNMNIMFGLPETLGIDQLPIYP